MLRRMAIAATCIAALTGTAGPVSAQDKLVVIGSKDVALSSGSETIDVSKAKGSFKAIRLFNNGEPIDISRIRIVYGDNSFHSEERRIDLRKSERTREIDPRKSGKFVDTVAITFKPAPGTQAVARIDVYGLQDDAGSRALRPSAAGTGPVAGAPRPSPSAQAANETPSAAARAAATPAASAPVEVRPIRAEPSPAKGRCLGRGNLLIGSANVGLGNDRDVIRVGARIGQFEKLRLCVVNNDVDLLSAKVTFVDKTTVELPYAGLIRANHRTQPLELKGDRFIDSVELRYKKRSGGGFAEVELWGELSEDYLDERAKLYDDGWVPLVSMLPARFVGFTVDKEAPGRHKQGFSEVRMVARDRDVTAEYITLTFADGKSQKFDLKRARVENGKPSVGLKIDGGRKVISEIEAKYRSRFFDPDAKGKDKALVEIWGKR